MFYPRVNGKIKATEVRVVSEDRSDIGVFPIADALNLVASRGMDLIEIEPQATPPVCLMMDFGMYRYREKKSHES